tara:strand:+ start:1105 stop:1305 length:201 start_codon:yes stop_codon:yes gene_type:complete
MKYQDKDGTALNFSGNCGTSVLVREVISEAIGMLKDIPGKDLQTLSGVGDTIEFLKENFDIKDKNE